MNMKELLRAMAYGAIGVLVACGIVWLSGILPPSRENTLRVLEGWLIGEAILAIGIVGGWLLRQHRMKAHRYDHHEINDNDPFIIELRRRGRVTGLSTPPWHGEDGA